MSNDKTRREAIEDADEASERIVSSIMAAMEADGQTIVAKEQPKEGVLAPASNGKIQGRWLPGQSGNPSGKNLRRRGDIVRALEEGVSLSAIVATINGLLIDRSWRARHAGAVLALSYLYGTPVQRSISASTKLDTFLDAVRDLSDDEFTQVQQRIADDKA